MTMFLVGGGPAASLDGVHDEFVEQARKRGSRIGIAMLGAEDEVGEYLAEYSEPITRRWAEVEIVPIWLDDEPDPADNSTVWPDDFASLAGLVVCGGWTPGYLTALLPRRDEVARLVRGGAPYLGFSAGAMVVSKQALMGGWKYRGRQIAPEVWSEGLEEVEVREGLALIGPTVDVHTDVIFVDRMLAALESGRVSSGVAIDENTALVVDVVSGRTRVAGEQRVHWLGRHDGASSVRHESSPAELERHRLLLEAEQAEAERLAAEQAEAERAAAAAAEAAAAETNAAQAEPVAEEAPEPAVVEAEVVEVEEPTGQSVENSDPQVAS